MADNSALLAISIANNIPENRRAEFHMLYQSQKKDRGTALLLGLLLGFWGADRFYLGQVGLGILKIVTVGGLGFWWLIDLFIIMGAADRHNAQVLQNMQMMFPQASQAQGAQPWR